MALQQIIHSTSGKHNSTVHDPHLWSSNWPLPADSGEFSEIFYANILRKIDFCAQNIFLRKSTQIWGDKTELSKKK